MSENRTNEFLSIAKSVTSTSRSSTGSITSKSLTDRQQQEGAPNGSKKNFQELRSFHAQAAGISKDIASTSALLTQLTDKVKHKSLLFQDEDSVAVNSLVVRIKQSIENLNSRLDVAQKTIEHQKRTYGKNSQAAEASANLVSGLQNEFMMTASNFKAVLQQRTESLKEDDDFKRQIYSKNNGDEMDDIPDMSSQLLKSPPPMFGTNPSSSLHHASSMPGSLFPTLDLTSALTSGGAGGLLDNSPSAVGASSLPRPHGITSATGGSTAFYQRSLSTPYNNPYSASNPLTPHEIQRMEEESGSSLSLQLLPTQQTDYLQSRADAMSEVEANIVELGTIFNKLAGLVNEHKEMIQRVEDNVEEANTNVLLSMNVLTDTLTSLRSNKMLALKVFSILVSFIILFIVFFA